MRENEFEGLDELICFELKEFSAIFPSDEHCLEALFQLYYPDGEMPCKHCGGRTEQRDFGARFAVCSSCRKHSWVTANTPFHGVRRLKDRFASIWLLDRGVHLNSTRLQRALALPLSTAWSILQSTLALVANEMLERFPMVQVNAFASIVLRRSRESLASEHPVAEIERKLHDQEASGGSDIAGCVPGSGCTNKEKVMNALESGKINFDGLCDHTGLSVSELSVALTLLEFEGAIVRLCGDIYSKNWKDYSNMNDPGLSSGVKVVVNRCQAVLRRCFQGVSLKYLQNYLAYAWIVLDRQYWSAGEFLKMTCLAKKLNSRKLFQGTSPSLVAIFTWG